MLDFESNFFLFLFRKKNLLILLIFIFSLISIIFIWQNENRNKYQYGMSYDVNWNFTYPFSILEKQISVWEPSNQIKINYLNFRPDFSSKKILKRFKEIYNDKYNSNIDFVDNIIFESLSTNDISEKFRIYAKTSDHLNFKNKSINQKIFDDFVVFAYRSYLTDIIIVFEDLIKLDIKNNNSKIYLFKKFYLENYLPNKIELYTRILLLKEHINQDDSMSNILFLEQLNNLRNSIDLGDFNTQFPRDIMLDIDILNLLTSDMENVIQTLRRLKQDSKIKDYPWNEVVQLNLIKNDIQVLEYYLSNIKEIIQSINNADLEELTLKYKVISLNSYNTYSYDINIRNILFKFITYFFIILVLSIFLFYIYFNLKNILNTDEK